MFPVSSARKFNCWCSMLLQFICIATYTMHTPPDPGTEIQRPPEDLLGSNPTGLFHLGASPYITPGARAHPLTDHSTHVEITQHGDVPGHPGGARLWVPTGVRSKSCPPGEVTDCKKRWERGQNFVEGYHDPHFRLHRTGLPLGLSVSGLNFVEFDTCAQNSWVPAAFLRIGGRKPCLNYSQPGSGTAPLAQHLGCLTQGLSPISASCQAGFSLLGQWAGSA